MDASVAAAPEATTPAGRVVAAVEKWFIVGVIAVMAILPVLEILGRKLFASGVPGGLLYTQHLTLWAGFVGALLATSAGKHLALATPELLPAGKLRQAAHVFTHAVSATVCALLAVASVDLVRADMERTSALPGGIPEWVSETVMPLSLAAMALRFAWRASDRAGGRFLAVLATALVAGLSLLPGAASAMLLPGSLLLLAALALGAPVFAVMAGLAMLLFFAEGTAIAAVPTETFRLVASPTLPAIPLLTVAGYILAEGGSGQRLLRLSRAWVGWLPGGMALMVCIVCAVFTTFTGGSGVTILALGGLVLPMLTSEKYPEDVSLGLVTTSGSLGLLFPPSLPVILYAVVAGASVEELFIAGLVPGLLMLALVGGYGMWMGAKAKAPRHPFELREALFATWQAKFDLAIPAIVVIAIFTGVATMVEAAALALLVAAAVESLLFRSLHPWKQLPAVIARAATLVGAVLVLLGVAMGLTSWLVDAEIPGALLTWTKTHIESPVVFLLVLNVVLLVIGSVVEIYAAIVILAPLLAPMAAAYGIDPLHLGIVFLANLELGFLFPPMGLNLILASSRFNQPLGRLYRVALPYLGILAVGVLLVTYVPAMSTGVLTALRGPKVQQAVPVGGGLDFDDAPDEVSPGTAKDAQPATDEAGKPPLGGGPEIDWGE